MNLAQLFKRELQALIQQAQLQAEVQRKERQERDALWAAQQEKKRLA